MGVVFGEEIAECSHLGHQGKEVGVVEEEDMQPHLNVVALGVFPTAHLAAHEGARLIEIHLVAGINQINRRRQPSQTRTHDGDPHAPSPQTVGRLYGEARPFSGEAGPFS